MTALAKVATCLWFDGKAEEATRFYVGIVPDSSLDLVVPYEVETPGGKVGDTMLTLFRLGGQNFMGLNGGPAFDFTPAMSISVELEGQAEIDRVWDALLEGGKTMACGWLTDRYGLSWQVVPASLPRMIQDANKAKARAVTEAMMTMIKLDEAALRRAFDAA